MRKIPTLLALTILATLSLGFGVLSANHNRDGPNLAATSLSPLANSSAVVTNSSANLESTVISPAANWVISRSQELEGNLRTGDAATAATNPVLLFYIALIGISFMAFAMTTSTTVGSVMTLLRALGSQIGGATGSWLRPLGTLAPSLGVLLLVATTFAASTGTVHAGNGGYLGQDDSASFPLWPLVVLALTSVTLVAGGLIARRTDK